MVLCFLNLLEDEGCSTSYSSEDGAILGTDVCFDERIFTKQSIVLNALRSPSK